MITKNLSRAALHCNGVLNNVNSKRKQQKKELINVSPPHKYKVKNELDH